jgi:hypothetical protein
MNIKKNIKVFGLVFLMTIMLSLCSSQGLVTPFGTSGVNYSINVNYSTLSNYSTYSGDAHLFDGYSSSGLYSYYKSLFDLIYAPLSSLANYVPLAGGTMTGNLTAPYFIGNGSQLTGLPTPDLSSYVPYTGATSNVDLGSNNLSITDNEDIASVKTFQIGSSDRLTYSEGYGTGFQTPINDLLIGYTGDTSTKFGMEIINSESTYYPVRVGIGMPANTKYYGNSLSVKGNTQSNRYQVTGYNMYFGYSSGRMDFYSHPQDISFSYYNGATLKSMIIAGQTGLINILQDLTLDKSLFVGENLNVTGNITSLGFNTGKNQVTQLHNNITTIQTSIDTWKNISWNLMVDDKTTTGYTVTDDNESVTINFDGIIRVQGCLHPYNNNIGNKEAKILVRTLINGVEARCLQASKTKSFKSSGVDILEYTGTITAEEGQKVQIQWRVDDTDIELRGDTDFDNPVSASLNLERISN